MGGRDGQPVGPGKIHEGLVALLRRAKLRGELRGRDEMPELRTGRIVEIMQQSGQAIRIARRQADRQVQALCAIQATDRRQSCGHGWDVSGQLLQIRRPSRGEEKQPNDRGQPRVHRAGREVGRENPG